MSNPDLVAATRVLVERARCVEAELLLHLGEIDERKLFLDYAFSSMFAFCAGELGFSEDAAYHRIAVARAARRWPAVLDALRLGPVHLSGLRLLAPHFTDENHREVLLLAAGKSKRAIEELVARIAPRPPALESIRKLPERVEFDAAEAQPALPVAGEAQPVQALKVLSSPLRRPEEHRPVIAPLTADTFRFQFTGTRALRDKLRQAQDLLRHRMPEGDLAAVTERAVDL